MDRRRFLKISGFSAAAFALTRCSKLVTGPSSKKPNIIVCMVDDMGFSDPGG